MKTIKARPTTYKGIQMRSRLEADYAAALDRDGEKWEYEPTCFAGPDGQWLPDFRIGHDSIYTELKPAHLIAWDTREPLGVYERIDKILQQMTVTWLSEPEATLRLVFWSYGCEQMEAPLVIMGSQLGPRWLAYMPSTLDLPMLWPGMGQAQSVADGQNGKPS